MNFNIDITIDGAIPAVKDIEISIDNSSVNFLLTDNSIKILSVDSGFHILKLKNKKNIPFKISCVKIGGCDIRKLLFLSYMENNDGNKIQPSTEFWEENQTWILPFISPVSNWLSRVEKKITNDVLGQNLFDKFWFFYPDRVNLDKTKFPQMLQDFFKYNFDFAVVDKANLDTKNIPFMEFTKTIPDNLIKDVVTELQNNLELIDINGLDHGLRDENLKEYQNLLTNQEWRTIWLCRRNLISPLYEKFPAVQKLINFLDIDYWYSFIGFLPPGGFIYPHIDDHNFTKEGYSEYEGCTQLYIPLDWPHDNYIKFADVGVLSLADGKPMVINTDYFTHSVVNASDKSRFILGIRAHRDILKDCVIKQK